MTLHYSIKQQKGFSLVELLVALAISATLMAGVIQVFSGSKQTDRLAMAIARIQESGRFAVDILNRELQHIGYMGCYNPIGPPIANPDETAPDPKSMRIQANNFPLYRVDSVSKPADLTNNIVRGLNNFAAATTDVDFGNGAVKTGANPLTGTDALFTMRATSGVALLSNNADFSGNILIQDNQFGFAVRDIALLTNCRGVNIFRISSISTTPPWTITHETGPAPEKNASAEFDTQYQAGSELHRIVYNSYYIRNNPRGIPSLYRDNVYVGETELISGVENLQVLYGHYDSKNTSSLVGDEIRWVDANTINTTASLKWRKVTSVRLAMLMRDEDNVLPTQPATAPSRSFQVLDTTVTIGDSNDRRIRKVFTTTAKIRNRRGEVDYE